MKKVTIAWNIFKEILLRIPDSLLLPLMLSFVFLTVPMVIGEFIEAFGERLAPRNLAVFYLGFALPPIFIFWFWREKKNHSQKERK